MAETCAIVVNWNGLHDTLECLDSLYALKPGPETIVLCDNGSTDGSREAIPAWAKKHYDTSSIIKMEGPVPHHPTSGPNPSFVFIRNKSNLGYGGAINAGIRYALSRECFDFVWILNNDIIAAPGALDALLVCAKNNLKAGIFGSTVVYADQRGTVQCAGGCRYNSLTTIFRHALGKRPVAEVLKEVKPPNLDYVLGACMFVRIPVFLKCGFFNEDYFLFFEELDFCRGAKSEGFELAWCRQSIIYHKGSRSIGTPDSGDKGRTSLTNYHDNLSTLIYTRKFHPWLLPFAMIFRFFGKLTVIIGRREWYLIKPLLKAYVFFWRHFL